MGAVKQSLLDAQQAVHDMVHARDQISNLAEYNKRTFEQQCDAGWVATKDLLGLINSAKEAGDAFKEAVNGEWDSEDKLFMDKKDAAGYIVKMDQDEYFSQDVAARTAAIVSAGVAAGLAKFCAGFIACLSLFLRM